MAHIYNRIFFSHENLNLAICDMEVEGIMLSELSQTEKRKYH